MKSKLLTVALLCCAVFGLRFYTSSFEEHKAVDRTLVTEGPANEPQLTDQVGARIAIKTPAPRADILLNNVPRVDQVRADVMSDPHHVPESVLDFARSLAPRMRQAMESGTRAEEFGSFLAECAIDANKNGIVASVQSICLADLKRISVKYPKLASLYEEALNNTSEDARMIINSL